jgi:hypothetical protein
MFEKIYINRISNRLELFKNNGNDIYSCRCMKCGDSKTKKHKTRFFIFQHKNKFFVKCFNCGYANSFEYFLKDFDFNLYTEYKTEKLKLNNYTYKEPELKITTNINSFDFSNNILSNYQSIRNTNNSNIYNYFKSRKINEFYYDKFYAIKDINSLSSKLEKYKDKKYFNADSILIPAINKDNNLNYIQTRYIETQQQKFLSFTILENYDNIFNENNLDFSKRISITEGSFDATHVNNCCSIFGINNIQRINYLKSINPNIRIIVDNDYSYNHEVKKSLNYFIDNNFQVVIYDKQFKDIKDLNESIIRNKFTEESLNEYLDTRTFTGLRARLELAKQLKNF